MAFPFRRILLAVTDVNNKQLGLARFCFLCWSLEMTRSCQFTQVDQIFSRDPRWHFWFQIIQLDRIPGLLNGDKKRENKDETMPFSNTMPSSSIVRNLPFPLRVNIVSLTNSKLFYALTPMGPHIIQALPQRTHFIHRGDKHFWYLWDITQRSIHISSTSFQWTTGC